VYDTFNIDHGVTKDGDFGHNTFIASKETATALGVVGEAQDKLKQGRLSEGTQKLIRGRRRTEEEQAAAANRDDYRQGLRKKYSKNAGERAVQMGRKLLGVHEEPPGSNWGPKVSDFILFTGYSGPVFWCGCYACWVVVKLGEAKIPDRIRMGYAPYITADAQGDNNGFHSVRSVDARPGDVVCLWGGQHVEVIAEKPSGGVVRCIGGNTSNSGQDNNGGEVCENTRALSDFDSGIVARPNWG
jgi:hypothetical protein